MRDNSFSLLEKVAQGFGDLNKKVFYLGGSTLSLYVPEYAAAQNRVVGEVDCILGSLALNDYFEWEGMLRERGFVQGDVPNRWSYQGIPVNIIARNREALGYNHRWLDEGIFHAQSFSLPDGNRIRSFTPAYFIAAKIEAFLNQAEGDFRTSEDFEDLMFVLDHRMEIVSELCQSFYEVRDYIQAQFKRFLQNPTLEEGLYYVLPFGTDEMYISHIRSLLQSVIDYKPSLQSSIPTYRQAIAS
ncbi:MAG: hypothetical protein AAFQ68_01355 [Bacteroidota bacterium]